MSVSHGVKQPQCRTSMGKRRLCLEEPATTRERWGYCSLRLYFLLKYAATLVSSSSIWNTNESAVCSSKPLHENGRMRTCVVSSFTPFRSLSARLRRWATTDNNGPLGKSPPPTRTVVLRNKAPIGTELVDSGSEVPMC
eukprot:1187147-Prorocentrum_minimum.AAC.6